MPIRIKTPKWILYRHTSSFNIVKAVAASLKYDTKSKISEADKLALLKKLRELGFYKERNPDLPLDAMQHRINTLGYFMFGYKDKINGEDRFLYSPLGNAFLKYMGDKAKLSKIFLTMLWAVQFQHPHSRTPKQFQLYPFRLIFKLLADDRLSHKLYAYEVAYFVVVVEKATTQTYEELVKNLLDIRTWSDKKIIEAFKADEHLYVNSSYEWDYYLSKLFEEAGILKRTEGHVITRLIQGEGTKRKVTRNFVELADDLTAYSEKLQETYPFTDTPLPLDDSERLRIDVVKEIYSFYPTILLKEIGEQQDELQAKLLELPKLIEQYADNHEGEETELFERTLEEAFNLFINIRAKWIGGPGQTDVECLYVDKKKKFAVDAKSTKNKLSSLSAGRLADHRSKIGAQYTIIITPRYVPAVLTDITDSPVVVVRASTFAEYLSNHIDNEIREIDYADFDDIITKNLGKDISEDISTLTLERFSVEK